MAHRNISFKCSDRMQAMIDDLMSPETGLGEINVSGLVRRAIAELHRRNTAPAYAKQREWLAPEARALNQEKMTEAKSSYKDRKYRSICERLGGKVVQGGSGFVCVFENFSKMGVFEQTLPLDHMEESLVEGQFTPNREAIELLVATGKLKAKLPPRVVEQPKA